MDTLIHRLDNKCSVHDKRIQGLPTGEVDETIDCSEAAIKRIHNVCHACLQRLSGRPESDHQLHRIIFHEYSWLFVSFQAPRESSYAKQADCEKKAQTKTKPY